MKKKGKNINTSEQMKRSKLITKKYMRSYAVVMIIFSLIGGVLGFYMAMNLRSMMDLFWFTFYFIAILIHVIIHEAGHLVFGLFTDYEFVSFRIFSIVLIKENGKIKRKKYNIPGAAGQCIMSPPENTNNVFPYKLYNYGGGLLNLITSIPAALCIIIFPGMPYIVKHILGSFAFAGIILAITNLLSLKAMGVATDGYNVKSMKKDLTSRHSFYIQLDTAAKQMSGMRLRDMPKERFELPEGCDLTNVLNAYVKIMEYDRYLDVMDFEGAKKPLEELEVALSDLPIAFLNNYNMCNVFLRLIEGNMAEVDNYLTKQVKQVLKSVKKELNIMRIVYAYHSLYTKDRKAAEKCYKDAINLASQYPIKPEADMNIMLIDYIRKLANEVEE